MSLHVSSVAPVGPSDSIRSTQRKIPRGRDDEDALTADLVALDEQYGALWLPRKISALLKAAGGSSTTSESSDLAT